MTRRKRVSAPHYSDVSSQKLDVSKESASDNQPFVAFLSHVTDGCTIQDIDPSSCIRLHISRPLSNNAGRMLKAIINDDCEHAHGFDNKKDTTLTGYVSGSPTSEVR